MLALTLLIAGCTASPPSKYQRLTEWATRLQIGSVGSVQIRDYHGSSGFSDDPPTLQVLESGDELRISDRLQAKLQEYHFTERVSGSWESSTEAETRSVSIEHLHPGDTWHFIGTGKTVRVAKDSLLISLQVASTS